MNTYLTTSSKEKPMTVSQVTDNVKGALERLPPIWLVGEISNFKRAGSGHWYFSLKDGQSQIRCNMWRSYTSHVRFRVNDGAEVLVRGSLNVYAPRGEYSLVVEQMEEMGMGRLRMEFERLKAQLQKEGLFEQAHKKPLPLLPRKVGIVTSPTGAAIRDMLRVMRERFAGIHVLIFPARVQGEGASAEIAMGIQWLDNLNCDAIIIGRGGGSEEDLWAFNEELVARTVFAARTPIISAVGHEVDFTIADFVADVRAATPSNAAELVVRSHLEYRQSIGLCRENMARAMQRRLLQLKNRVNVSESHPIFIKVRSRVNDHQRRISDIEYRMQRAMSQRVRALELRLMQGQRNLGGDRLLTRIQAYDGRLTAAAQALPRLMEERLNKLRVQIGTLIFRLEDLSPLKILGKGYAAVYNSKGNLVRSPSDVRFGEVIRARVADGEILARVLDHEPEATQGSLFGPDEVSCSANPG